MASSGHRARAGARRQQRTRRIHHGSVRDHRSSQALVLDQPWLRAARSSSLVVAGSGTAKPCEQQPLALRASVGAVGRREQRFPQSRRARASSGAVATVAGSAPARRRDHPDLRRERGLVVLEQVVVVAVERADVDPAGGEGLDHAARVDQAADGARIEGAAGGAAGTVRRWRAEARRRRTASPPPCSRQRRRTCLPASRNGASRSTTRSVK